MPLTGVQSTKDATYWREQVKLAQAVNDQLAPWQDANLKAYAPSPSSSPDGYGTQINTNRDFTLVERKKADLFYQRPEVSLSPSPLLEGPIYSADVDLMTGQPKPLMGPVNPQTQQAQPIPSSYALAAHQEIVNEHLGPDGVNATRMAHQALFDVLTLSGVGYTVMGYESATVDVDSGQVDPLTGKPKLIPVPIKESCYWQHFSPKQALKPHNFRSTEWDRAPWLGHRFELPLTAGNRKKFKLPSDFTGQKSDSKQYFDHGMGQSSAEDVFTGAELWYRSCLFREDRPHPDHLTHLVLVDGVDEPVIEEDCPYQTLDPQGQLTPDSLIGFPIHPLNTRTLTDSSNPPSDCTLIRPLVNELNRFREQMVEYRDAQTLKWTFNMDVLPAEIVGKIVRSPIGGMIGIPGDAFAGEGAIKELPHGSMPRESFTSNDYIDADIARTTAIDAAGAGVQSTGSQTATEAQIQQGNANARLDFERGVVLQWYVSGVTKFSTLLQRYLPVKDAAKIVGVQRAQVWDVWRRTVASNLAFTAMPDSALRVDQAVDRKQAQDLYSFLANDPYVQKGRAKLLEKLLRKFHIDPEGIVAAPDPAKPEPPKLSISIKGEDFVGPQAPIIIELAQQLGLTISDEAKQATQALGAIMQALQAQQAQAEAQTKHGGKLPQQESLSKHSADLTGGLQGTGAVTPMGAGGHLQ
jgi:hypothetical protein